MKRLIQLLMLTLLVPTLAAAKVWDEAQYKQIEQSIRVPKFADKEYVITKYGAKLMLLLPRTRRPFRRLSTSALRRAVVRSSFPQARSSSLVPSP